MPLAHKITGMPASVARLITVVEAARPSGSTTIASGCCSMKFSQVADLLIGVIGDGSQQRLGQNALLQQFIAVGCDGHVIGVAPTIAGILLRHGDDVGTILLVDGCVYCGGSVGQERLGIIGVERCFGDLWAIEHRHDAFAPRRLPVQLRAIGSP